jgi:RNA polymerase primary sigma factor
MAVADEGTDVVTLYLRELNGDLLSAGQEVALARAIARGRRAKALLCRAAGNGKTARLERAAARGAAAREKLIVANRRLVVSIAKKHLAGGVPLADLVQEGNVGLVLAAEQYDYRRGVRFASFAFWPIRQAITRAIAQQRYAVHVPAGVHETLRKLRRVAGRLALQGRAVTAEMLAQEMGLPARVMAELLPLLEAPLSLDQPVGEGDGRTTLGDFVADGGTPPPDEAAALGTLRGQLETAMNRLLTERERRVLQLHFGWDSGGDGLTLGEIGRELGLTAERIRVIEEKALKKLNRWYTRYGSSIGLV